jgi:hypothetical protein
MESDRSELNALASTLDDVRSRITAVADRYQGTTRPDVAEGLYEVERSLTTAGRQLERMLRTMR